MVIALVRPAIVVLQQIIKHRKTIYKVLTAQDKYIAKSMKAGGYGKQASYGVRSGALAGSVIGSIINNAEDTPGNGVSQPWYGPQTSPPNKARVQQPVRNRSRNSSKYCIDYRSGRSRPRKY